MIEEFIKAFFMVLVIMDPFGGVPMFLSLTQNFTKKETQAAANSAAGVAFMLALLFILLGGLVLKFFGISLESFKIAGGIIFIIMGIVYVLDIKLSTKSEYGKNIIVPVATPLIAGPGLLTTIVIINSLYGHLIALFAVVPNLLLFWILMHHSKGVYRLIGKQGTEIISQIMGLIIVGIGVEFILTGIKSLI